MALVDILRELAWHEVEFIVVGGMAGLLRGAPVVTQDVDVVYARNEANITRLMTVLAELDAVSRTDARRLRIDESLLRSTGHNLLATKLGVLGLLGTIAPGVGYDELWPDSQTVPMDGRNVRVVTLERLIEVKRGLPRPKDKFMLIQLEATLDEQRKAKGQA
ncbi:MAG: hypothetical protein ACHREM_24735 [Polyangiales bacterium]